MPTPEKRATLARVAVSLSCLLLLGALTVCACLNAPQIANPVSANSVNANPVSANPASANSVSANLANANPASANPAAPSAAPEAPVTAVSAYREERERARLLAVEELTHVASDQTASASLREAAGVLLAETVRRAELETSAQLLLAAKGVNEPVVVIGGAGVCVLVRDAQLDAAEAARICEIASRETGLAPSSIKIIPMP